MSSSEVRILLGILAVLAAPRAQAEIIDLSVRLDPDCALAVSDGLGSGTLTLDTSTGVISFDIGFATDSPILFSHIHGPFALACGGPPSGGIVHSFGIAGSPYQGDTVAFNELQMRGFIQRQYYVNIHTGSWPDGELRGYIELSRKSRYLTWHPSLIDDPRLQALSSLGLRVTIETLPHFPATEGTTLWVGPSGLYPEENVSEPGKTFTGANLQCTPHIQDWSAPTSLHIAGGEIMPDSIYRIEMYDPACGDVNNPACFFGAYVAHTSRFGDVVGPLAVADEVGQPDFRDISEQVNKFLADPTAPIKAAAHLVPNMPDSSSPTDFRTISASVNAFLGVPYTSMLGITGPCVCPSTVTCGTACLIDNQCGAGVCFSGFCADQCGRCSP